MKRNLLCFVAMLLMMLSSGLVAHADTVQVKADNSNAVVLPRAEETEWCFRRNPDTGVLEKRLWSNTYGKWKTEWEPVL